MRPLRSSVLLTAIVLGLPGCAGAFPELAGKGSQCGVREGSSGWERQSDGVLTRTLDFGTGTPQDVQKLSPHFYMFASDLPVRHRTFEGVEQARQDRKDMESVNRSAVTTLQAAANPDGVRLVPVQYDGATVVAIEAPNPNPTPRVRIWTDLDLPGPGRLPAAWKLGLARTKTGAAHAPYDVRLLVSWTGCSRVQLVQTCDNGNFSSTLKLAGNGVCVPGDDSGERPLVVEVKLSHRQERYRVSLAPEPRMVHTAEGKVAVFRPEHNEDASGAIAVRLLDGEGKDALWQGEVRAKDFADSTPDEVLALFSAGEDEAGAVAYAALPEVAEDAAFAKKVVDARRTGVRQVLEACAGQAPCLAQAAPINPKNQDVPGTEEVRKQLAPALITAMESVQGDGAASLLVAGVLMVKAMTWDRPDFGPYDRRLASFESRFGPGIADGRTTDATAIDVFGILLPDSKYLAASEARKQAGQEAAAADREHRRLARMWEEVEYPADDVAITRFRARLARQISPSRQTMAGAARMDQHAQEVLRDQFCPAKKRFIQASSRKVYDEWAKDKCQNNPPTTSGRDGDEVTLTQDCRAVYATACP